MCASDAARNLFCKRTPKQLNIFHGLVAQLVEQLTLNQWVQGCTLKILQFLGNPLAPGLEPWTAQQLNIFHGLVAQLVEQLTLNQWVQGSSPCKSTKKPAFHGWLFSCSGCKG